MLPFALFEAAGACVLELDAGTEELAIIVEVDVDVSVAVEVEVETGLEVDGGGAAVSSIWISQSNSRLWAVIGVFLPDEVVTVTVMIEEDDGTVENQSG
jgi:hypothetical protein